MSVKIEQLTFPVLQSVLPLLRGLELDATGKLPEQFANFVVIKITGGELYCRLRLWNNIKNQADIEKAIVAFKDMGLEIDTIYLDLVVYNATANREVVVLEKP